MRRAIVPCLAAVLLIAGCGGSKGAGTLPPAPTIPTSTDAPVPTLTSASDVAACNEMARNLNVVSAMIQNNEKIITNALHPKELAKSLVAARKVLLYAATVMRLGSTPHALVGARDNFVSGLHSLAADYKRAQPFVAKGNMAVAATYMQDGPAFQKIKASTTRIQKTCNA